jgi:hypothetical protein
VDAPWTPSVYKPTELSDWGVNSDKSAERAHQLHLDLGGPGISTFPGRDLQVQRIRRKAVTRAGAIPIRLKKMAMPVSTAKFREETSKKGDTRKRHLSGYRTAQWEYKVAGKGKLNARILCLQGDNYRPGNEASDRNSGIDVLGKVADNAASATFAPPGLVRKRSKSCRQRRISVRRCLCLVSHGPIRQPVGRRTMGTISRPLQKALCALIVSMPAPLWS